MMNSKLAMLIAALAIVFIGCNSSKSTTKTSDVLPSGKMVDGVREISMKAFQFGFDPETIVVKKGENVRLKAMSQDVAHGIAIHDLNISQELPPNEEKIIEFTPQETGDYNIHCSVYCGSGHGKMHAMLKVIE